MHKIPQDKLQNIANNTGQLVEVINEGIQWVNHYLKDATRADTNYDVKKYRRTLNKVKAVVTEKPVIALFGASQVGKSYMANNLLYDNDNKLLVYNHPDNETIDFIKYINPEGKGNEATGAVTRFTADYEQDKNRFPVKIKVFSPKDVIAILCDTYYYDFNDRNPLPSKEHIKEHIQEIASLKGSSKQTVLNDDDIYEVKEYVEKYFFKNSFVMELRDSGFWDVVADAISHIPHTSWVAVLEILWNKHKEISGIFRTFMNYLNELEFQTEMFVRFEALYRKSGRALINVQTLQDLFDDNHSFQVQSKVGKVFTASAAKLCFVTSEIALSVSQGSIDNRPFIKEVDIIDFPGARSRPEVHDLAEKSLLEMLLRGKVSYLFNYYSSNYKSNTLSVCMRTQQTNVTTVPRLVNQWIEDNLGENAEERTANIKSDISPLFIIFTWWNTQLEFKKATDDPDPSERIEKLFETRFRQEVIGDYKWHEQWMFKGGALSRFYNFYLLRDFKESLGIFNTDADGKEDPNNPFTSPEQEDFHKRYFDKFVEYHKNENRFFPNPEMNFEEASTVNKDGSELIIKNLVPVSSNTVSVPIYLNILNKSLEKAQAELDKHYHSDKADEQIRDAARIGSELQLKMNIVFGLDAFYFGSFVEHLTVSEDEIIEFYHVLLRSEKLVRKKDTNQYILIRARSPRITSDKTFTENLEVLRQDYNRDSLEETEQFFVENEGIDLNELFYGDLHNLQNNSLILAENAKDYWIEKKLNPDKFEYFIEKGFNKNLLERLFDNLKVSFKKLKISKKIASEIREFVDVNQRIDMAEDMIAHITAGKINEFVNSVGWSYYSDEEKFKIKETNKANNLNLTIPEDKEMFYSLEKTDELAEENRMSVERLIDYMDNLNENLSRRPIDLETIKYVPMIRNYQRWSELMRISFIANCDIPTYNVEANQELGQILDKLKNFKYPTIAEM
ncbi:MAG: hypothetical protein JJT94_08035 [Bernardetiaceae bacterium]|nr:hypothetical protein [Bernardetiaceae bacterium]